MAHKETLGTDSEGRYRRRIGNKLGNGKIVQQVFRLGRIKTDAEDRNAKLEQLWKLVEQRWRKLRELHGKTADPVPMWDDVTLQIGTAIAQGKEVCALVPPTGMEQSKDLLNWLHGLTVDFPILPLRLADSFQPSLFEARQELEENANAADSFANKLKDMADVYGAAADYNRRKAGVATKNTDNLDKALTAYVAFNVKRYTGPDGLTEFGRVVGNRVESIRHELGDKQQLPLSKVDNSFLEEWVITWQNRPITPRYGKPCSIDYARGVIKTIRDFIRWLNRSSEFPWTKPTAYEVLPARIKETDEDVADTKRVRYKRDEVVTLWQYATPADRVFILLALNCGYGIGEIVTLRLDEVDLDRKLIRRNRRKTKISGKWRLWDETVTALRWYLDKLRPQSESPYLFLTKTGTPLRAKTKGGNRAQHIPSRHTKLTTRIKKDQPDFIPLSFNKLRKTGSNWIRAKFGAEIAELYLGHGRKEIVDAYTEKPFKLLYRSLRRYRKLLSPMFATVETPFPEIAKKSNPSLSLGKQNKIKEMRKGGYTYAAIKEQLGVSYDTIRRYSK